MSVLWCFQLEKWSCNVFVKKLEQNNAVIKTLDIYCKGFWVGFCEAFVCSLQQLQVVIVKYSFYFKSGNCLTMTNFQNVNLSFMVFCCQMGDLVVCDREEKAVCFKMTSLETNLIFLVERSCFWWSNEPQNNLKTAEERAKLPTALYRVSELPPPLMEKKRWNEVWSSCSLLLSPSIAAKIRSSQSLLLMIEGKWKGVQIPNFLPCFPSCISVTSCN